MSIKGAHVWEAEGVAEDTGGEEGGDDGLEAVGDVPGREAVAHAREQRHSLRLVPRAHLRAHASHTPSDTAANLTVSTQMICMAFTRG